MSSDEKNPRTTRQVPRSDEATPEEQAQIDRARELAEQDEELHDPRKAAQNE